jgi:hypothetical protein
MNLTKIKQYSINELLVIVIYKFFYKISLFVEKLNNTIAKEKYLNRNSWNISNSTIPAFSEFYSRCNHVNKHRIICEANEILDGKITVFGVKVNFDYNKDWLKDPIGSKFWHRNTFFAKAKTKQKGLSDVKYVLEVNKFNHLVRVALAYYYTHENKYIEYIEKSIQGYIRCVPYERSVVNRIIMDLGFRSINLIQISLLCWQSDVFKNKALPEILSLLHSFERQMQKFSSPRWFKTGNGVNHNTGEMTSLIITQLWLSLFGTKNYKKHLNKEFLYLHDVLYRTIAPSGAYLEQSANYARVVLEFLIIFDIFLNELYQKDLKTKFYFSKQYKERLLKYLQDLSNEGNLPNFGDNDNARVLWAFISDLNNYSYLGINPNTNADYNNSRGVINKYLDGSQWIFKSNDDNKIWMFTRVGKFAFLKEGVGAHVHNDILALLLSIKGKEVFIDRGTSFYNSDYNYIINDRKTAAHNTISIEGRELADILPVGYRNYPISEIIDDPNYIFSGIVKYNDIIHNRMIKHNNESICITDKIQSTTGHKNGQLNYLLAENLSPLKISDNQIQLFDKKDKIFLNISFKGVSSVNIVETNYYPNYAESKKTKSIQCSFSIKNEKALTTQIEIL